MNKNVVIIGASIAGINVMNTLVRNEYQGKISLIEKNNTLPYNPYKLNKDWMLDLEKVSPPILKKESFYEDNKIDLRLNTEVLNIDPVNKKLSLSNNETIDYDILVVATGSKLNKLDETADNLVYLRTFDDALNIKNKIKDINNISIIGAGFIGLELASTLRQLDKNVNVIMRHKLPLKNVLGKDMAQYVYDMHESHGVNFITEESVIKFEKENNLIHKLITDKSRKIETELVVAAIGVKPYVPFDIFNHELIEVNAYHQTSYPDIYAAGDNTKFIYNDELVHLEHWESAYYAGINIAKNILEANTVAYNVLPYFWTDQYDQTFEYIGYTKSFAHTYLRKEADDKILVAYTDETNKLLALLFINNVYKRKDMEKFFKENNIIDPNKFTDLHTKLIEE